MAFFVVDRLTIARTVVWLWCFIEHRTKYENVRMPLDDLAGIVELFSNVEFTSHELFYALEDFHFCSLDVRLFVVKVAACFEHVESDYQLFGATLAKF